MEEIIPFPKYYDWAQLNLTENICHDFLPCHENIKPIAELWYGTHIHGKACIKSTSEYLDDYLCRKMNYQFKLLSIGKPLSIQVHPSPDIAEKLHQQDPIQFPDGVGKYEMAMALSDDTVVFCGIRPFQEIQYEIQTYFEGIFDLQMHNNHHVIRDLFINVLEMNNETYQKLRKRLFFEKKYELFRYLEYHFPNDRGCALCVLFLNEIHLKKYDTVYIPTGTIHCYIQGNLFESMASSDNVIRIGLTTKHKNYTAFFQYSHFHCSNPYQYLNTTKDICPILPKLRLVRENSTVVLSIPKKDSYFFIVMLEGECICNKKLFLRQRQVYLIKNSTQVFQFEHSNYYSFMIVI
jgi:mannose-6-phosphate isomerase